MKKVLVFASLVLVLSLVMGCPLANDSKTGNGGGGTPVVETVASPVIRLLGSDVDVSQKVEITSTTPSVSIFYTLDKSEPATSVVGTTKLYDSDNKPTIALSATITAVAVKDGMTNSEVVSHTKTLTMIPITGGEFARDNDGTDPETETTAITVSSFLLGETEVTQAQWFAVMTDNPIPSNSTGDENLPVDSITWYEAVNFCNALSTAEGLTPFYTVDGNTVTVDNWKAEGYRLPTEAEWEYAAGGGESSARTIYAAPITKDVLDPNDFNDDDNTNEADGIDDNVPTKDLRNYAWYVSNANNTTHIVGTAGSTANPLTAKSGEANDLGLYDMSGNVWEWCWDRYDDYYDTTITENPTGATSGSNRVYRGGGWNNSSSYLRVAYRGKHVPGYRPTNLGMRVARSVAPLP